MDQGARLPLLSKDMSVETRKIRKILSSDLIAGSYTMNAARGVYNPVRDEFIVTVTQDDNAYVFWFSGLIQTGTGSVSNA